MKFSIHKFNEKIWSLFMTINKILYIYSHFSMIANISESIIWHIYIVLICKWEITRNILAVHQAFIVVCFSIFSTNRKQDKGTCADFLCFTFAIMSLQISSKIEKNIQFKIFMFITLPHHSICFTLRPPPPPLPGFDAYEKYYLCDQLV